MKKWLLAVVFSLFSTMSHAACTAGTLPFVLQNNTVADATQVMADFNQIVNSVAANCAGSGANSDITALLGLTTPLSYTIGGSSVYIGGTTGGTANAQTVASPTPLGFSLVAGKRIAAVASATNTGAMTLNINSTGATAVQKLGPSGLTALTGGEVVSGEPFEVWYDGTEYVLFTNALTTFGPLTTLASATSTDLGTISSHNISVTGTTTITSFGSTCSTLYPIYFIKFAGILTLTYNATSLIIPGSANITTAANDTAIAECLGSGNWQVRVYNKANGAAVVSPNPIQAAFKNLSIKVASTTTVTVAADAVELFDGTNYINVAPNATINLGTNGAVNTLDTGTIATNTWYFIWVISNGSTTGGLASTSSTAPTMPAGYTYKARLGAVSTINASATLYGTWQFGRRAQYVVGLAQTATRYLAASSASSAVGNMTIGASLVAVQVTGNGKAVPTTASVIFGAAIGKDGSTTNVVVAPNNGFGANTSVTNPPPVVLNAAANGTSISVPFSMVLESNSFYWGCNSMTIGAVAIDGWEDNI